MSIGAVAVQWTDELTDEEAGIYREWWELLNRGLPSEWLANERQAFVERLTAYRARLAEWLPKNETLEQGDLWQGRLETYEALATALGGESA